MATPQDTRKLWSAEITLGAADTTKTLVAAPSPSLAAGPETTIVVTHMVTRVITSAAQAIDIKIGTVNVKRLGVSEAVGSESFLGPMVLGIVGQALQPLTIVPAAAGPSVHVAAEGYYR